MWRWTKRVLAGFIGLLILLATLGAAYQWIATRRDLAAIPPPERLVDIGGYRLHIWCMGSGKPTVILDSGLGGEAFNWPHVQPEVAKFTQVCAYGIHRELQQDLLALSSRACQAIAERSSHAITGDEPQLVVEAIRAVVEAAKDSRSNPGC